MSTIEEILAARQRALDEITWDEAEQAFIVPAMGALIPVPRSYLATDGGKSRQLLRLLEKGATPAMVLAFAEKAGMNTSGPV